MARRSVGFVCADQRGFLYPGRSRHGNCSPAESLIRSLSLAIGHTEGVSTMYMTEARCQGVLTALSDGRPMARQDILARMGEDRMPGYPVTKLIEGGLIERPARATYTITVHGQLALADRAGASCIPTK